jgi:hypothetical protein
MDLPTELKSRLSAYLKENGGLDEFRIWFATVLRTANQYQSSVRKLVWSVDSALANFGSGRVSRSELHEELGRILEADGPETVGVTTPGPPGPCIILRTVVVGSSLLDFQPVEKYILSVEVTPAFRWAASGNAESVSLPVAETSVPPAWVVSELL